MKWINLRSNKCPKCSYTFSKFDDINLYCGHCQFVISQKKVNKVVTEMIDKEIEERRKHEK